MKRKQGFVIRDVCGEKVIVGEGIGAINFGKLLSLNDTAAWLWEHAEGDFSVESLAAALCSEYEVSEADALRDVANLTDKWRELGVIE